MDIDKKELLEIYNQESTIADTAREYCKRYDMEYKDSVRRRFSNIIRSEKENDSFLDVSTDTETNQYSNDKKEKDDFFMPSAWDSEKNRFLNIDEYCIKYGLPKDQVRSSKLVAHLEKHMIYNIVFNPTLNEQTGIDEDFIESVVKKHISPVHNTKPLPSNYNKEWVDRVVITDVHISMDTSGSRNVSPLYEDEWNKTVLFERLDILVNHIKTFKKGSVLIIDELGDFLDGLFSQTTRKSHPLPQNMSDKEAFEIGVEFKIKLVESLLPYYDKIVCNNITEDNHSGVFSFFVNSTVKKILHTKYSNVEYNLMEKFINHYSIGNYTFILSHGKDSESLKFGFKPILDSKQIEKIDQYCKEFQLYDGKVIEFSKGDSHQGIFDYTTSNDFEYCNYPAFSPPSNWVKTNFKNSKSGFVLQNIELNGKIKVVVPYWF